MPNNLEITVNEQFEGLIHFRESSNEDKDFEKHDESQILDHLKDLRLVITKKTFQGMNQVKI